jgi:putative AdoMet-dependent methyltransferase
MTESSRADIFNAWSQDYDREVAANSFPFIGYWEILETVMRETQPEEGMEALELGPGTGNLTAHLVAAGCRVLAVDFSPKMLELAQAKTPQARFLQADLLGEWPVEVQRGRFDRILSAYLFHEFKLPVKIDLLRRLAAGPLKPSGRIVIGDIAFPDPAARAEAMERFPDEWDEEEEFWAASQDLPALHAAGLRARYRQVSSCAGIFVIQPGGRPTDVVK